MYTFLNVATIIEETCRFQIDSYTYLMTKKMIPAGELKIDAQVDIDGEIFAVKEIRKVDSTKYKVRFYNTETHTGMIKKLWVLDTVKLIEINEV